MQSSFTYHHHSGEERGESKSSSGKRLSRKKLANMAWREQQRNREQDVPEVRYDSDEANSIRSNIFM